MLSEILDNAKRASRKTATLSAETKNKILQELADALRKNTPKILEENAKDVAEAEKNEMGAMTDRLLLTKERIENMAKETENVAQLHDFVGETIHEEKRPQGFVLKKIRVPMGVVAMIYESRPNVTIDASALAFKSGNAVVLKGGKEAKFSNAVLAKIFQNVLKNFDLENAVQLLENVTREDTTELMKAKGKVDLLIPRGGKGLIDFVTQNSCVPVIETGASVVHTFVDESANWEMAEKIIVNEKTRRVAVCNALDTILIHEKIAEKFLPILSKTLEQNGVQLHFESENFSKEWLSFDISVRIVKNLDEAMEHISQFSLGHSECIITENAENAEKFLKEVDAACVYHNASTCFSDGAQFGLGAEIGISTQKLHARGPFALEGLTTHKWMIFGNGEIRA